MKKFLEALPVIGIFIFLVGPSIIFRQWWLCAVFTVFGLCFGVIEAIANKFTGKTVSQHFWALKDKNKKAALIIVSCMVIAWGLLIFHFWVY